jgi:hypothetical protein
MKAFALYIHAEGSNSVFINVPDEQPAMVSLVAEEIKFRLPALTLRQKRSNSEYRKIHSKRGLVLLQPVIKFSSS